MATIQIPKGFQVFIQELNTIQHQKSKLMTFRSVLYATDASLYQLQPLAVAIPSHESDLIKIIQIANKYNIL
jgi:FAD/FMN-containing dehydrogenase